MHRIRRPEWEGQESLYRRVFQGEKHRNDLKTTAMVLTGIELDKSSRKDWVGRPLGKKGKKGGGRG